MFRLTTLAVTLLSLALALARRRRAAGAPEPRRRPPGSGLDVVPTPTGPRGWRLVAAVAALCLVATLAWQGWTVGDGRRQARAVAVALTRGDPSRGPALIVRYGCAGCHTIAGVPGADGLVGPPLASLRERVYVGGVARNTPDDLVRWIVAPQAFSPHSAMPATGITEAEARDVAAFLYTR